MSAEMLFWGIALALFLIMVSSIKIYRVDYISILIKEIDGSLCYKSISCSHIKADSWMLMDEIKKVVGVAKDAQIISMDITGYGYRMRRVRE